MINNNIVEQDIINIFNKSNEIEIKLFFYQLNKKNKIIVNKNNLILILDKINQLKEINKILILKNLLENTNISKEEIIVYNNKFDYLQKYFKILEINNNFNYKNFIENYLYKYVFKTEKNKKLSFPNFQNIINSIVLNRYNKCYYEVMQNNVTNIARSNLKELLINKDLFILLKEVKSPISEKYFLQEKENINKFLLNNKTINDLEKIIYNINNNLLEIINILKKEEESNFLIDNYISNKVISYNKKGYINNINIRELCFFSYYLRFSDGHYEQLIELQEYYKKNNINNISNLISNTINSFNSIFQNEFVLNFEDFFYLLKKRNSSADILINNTNIIYQKKQDNEDKLKNLLIIFEKYKQITNNKSKLNFYKQEVDIIKKNNNLDFHQLYNNLSEDYEQELNNYTDNLKIIKLKMNK